MAKMYFVLFFCAIFSISSGQQGIEGVLGDSKPCEESCVKSYSPHTNPEGGSESNACGRGCRLYTISEFVMRDGGFRERGFVGPLKTPAESCIEACNEAYNDTSKESIACQSGCKSQEEKRVNGVEEADDDSKPNIHLLNPLVRIRSVYSSVIGAVRVIRSSLVTFFSTDDNTVVAVEGAPEIMVEVLGDEGVGEGEGEDKSPLSPRLPSKPWLYSDDSSSGNILAEGVSRSTSADPSVVKCVSDRLGVPPPLLVVSALILVFFTIYVIFTICTTATPPKKHKAGLSIQSEPVPVPIKLVRPEDLTRLSLMEEDDLQAPPLPTKVKIPDTHV